MTHRKVAFQGEVYWLHEVEGGYNLSPLDHYADDGELLANPFHDISFAIVENGKIMRYQEQIGIMADLITVDEPVQLSFDFEREGQ